MFLWMISIAIGVSFLVVAAGAGTSDPTMMHAHLFVAGLIATVIALIAVRETRKLMKAGGSHMAVAASLTRFMGLIWAWGALVIVITYGTGILEWSGWWQYFIVFMVLSGLCLFLSKVLRQDDEEGRQDKRILRVSQYISGVTMFAMVVSAGYIGFARLGGLPAAEQGVWAADHVFVFGALALAGISSYLLKASVNDAQ